ncbi:hypothetical protein F1L81_00410 [Escherichia coli]|nr:hypothetical protein [Escherichia coli]EFE8283106.1 hypothetical protein [Escherichia coli]
MVNAAGVFHGEFASPLPLKCKSCSPLKIVLNYLYLFISVCSKPHQRTTSASASSKSYQRNAKPASSSFFGSAR